MTTQSRSRNTVPRGTIPDTPGPPNLHQKRDQLETRLENGYEMINKAEAEGKDVAAWEEAWLSLLLQYEAVCDAILGV